MSRLTGLTEQQQLVHAFVDGQTAILHDGKGLLPQSQQRLGIGIFFRPVSLRQQLHRLLLGQNQLRRALTAQAKADLGISGQKLAEPGMVIADLTQKPFAALQNQVAKVALVEERTALPLPQHKMGRIICRNMIPQPLSQGTGHGFITGKAFLVNINFPADAAAVLTGTGDAPKGGVIVGIYGQHGHDLLFLSMVA